MNAWKMGFAALAIAAVLSGCGGGATSSNSGGNSGGGSGCTSPKGGAASGTTAGQTVKIVPDPNTVGAYSPKSITVKVGDSVEWDWTDSSSPHTVTANDGSFDSCVQNAGFKFVVTFTKAGDVPYHCTLHAGMIGDVKVS